jgi:hypothetical protein
VQAFAQDELAMAYIRAIGVTFYIDQRAWMRRLGNVARLVHLSLFQQCAALNSARTAAAELSRVLAVARVAGGAASAAGDDWNARSRAFVWKAGVVGNTLLRVLRLARYPGADGLLVSAYVLPELGALPLALSEFETMRWSTSVAAYHAALTAPLLHAAWDLTGALLWRWPVCCGA